MTKINQADILVGDILLFDNGIINFIFEVWFICENGDIYVERDNGAKRFIFASSIEQGNIFK